MLIVLNKFVKIHAFARLTFMNGCLRSYFANKSSDLTSFTRNSISPLNPHIYNCLVVDRQFKTCSIAYAEESEVVEANESETKPAIDPKKDRTRVISPETSIRYLKSEAYKITYGDEPVWVKYRRNFKGQWVPRLTRRTCIRGGQIATGSPCPICRDEYLVVHYTNVDLLKQFINPYTGELYDCKKIHVCQKKLFQLEIAIAKAKFHGLLTYQVPFRKFDYKEYYPDWKE